MAKEAKKGQKCFFYFVFRSLKHMPGSPVSFGSENKIHDHFLLFFCFVHCNDESVKLFVLALVFYISFALYTTLNFFPIEAQDHS